MVVLMIVTRVSMIFMTMLVTIVVRLRMAVVVAFERVTMAMAITMTTVRMTMVGVTKRSYADQIHYKPQGAYGKEFIDSLHFAAFG